MNTHTHTSTPAWTHTRQYKIHTYTSTQFFKGNILMSFFSTDTTVHRTLHHYTSHHYTAHYITSLHSALHHYTAHYITTLPITSLHSSTSPHSPAHSYTAPPSLPCLQLSTSLTQFHVWIQKKVYSPCPNSKADLEPWFSPNIKTSGQHPFKLQGWCHHTCIACIHHTCALLLPWWIV